MRRRRLRLGVNIDHVATLRQMRGTPYPDLLAAARLFVSLERNMRCAVGFCGHCQYGGSFVCRDGPVFGFDRIEPLFGVREV